MKKLRRHPHVIELWGCVTKSGSRVVIGLIPPSGTNELGIYEPMTTWIVPLLLAFRAHDGYHRVCPVWRLAGLPEEEPRPERHLLQGPGCEAQDQPDVTAADEVRGSGGWRDGIFEFKQGGQTQESSNSQAKNFLKSGREENGVKMLPKIFTVQIVVCWRVYPVLCARSSIVISQPETFWLVRGSIARWRTSVWPGTFSRRTFTRKPPRWSAVMRVIGHRIISKVSCVLRGGRQKQRRCGQHFVLSES